MQEVPKSIYSCGHALRLHREMDSNKPTKVVSSIKSKAKAAWS